MPQNLTAIGFDADDTLWHNERYFRLSHARFTELLRGYTDCEGLIDRLLAAEERNLGHYGFGVKGFTLSMIETAIEVTEGKVPGAVISELLSAGKEMLSYPIELLPHARDAVETVAGRHTVVLITKGDLLDQERKLAQSGLGDFFDHVEIVSNKTPAIYAEIFARIGSGAEKGIMVGNSLRSDVEPMIAAGGWGVHVPHDLTWAYEAKAAAPTNNERFHTLGSLEGLAQLIARIN